MSRSCQTDATDHLLAGSCFDAPVGNPLHPADPVADKELRVPSPHTPGPRLPLNPSFQEMAVRLEQTLWDDHAGWPASQDSALGEAARLVLVFGSGRLLESGAVTSLQARYPNARLFGCSTAGEIQGTQVRDGSLVATAIQFASTRFESARVDIALFPDSGAAGRALAAGLSHSGLRHVIVLSDGLHVNGSELVAGLTAGLPTGVALTGGLSADGADFRRTLVLCDGEAREGAVVALGFYGERLRVGYGSLGGWDSFGPERMITRSVGNVLFELDGRPALDLYRSYLGEHAAQLPASGLLFPLNVRGQTSGDAVVRTILGIDETAGSLTFAGDVPQGSWARLMMANFDRLIDGAAQAARVCDTGLHQSRPELALLISCVGRKLLLQQRIEEEVEAVREVLGPQTPLAGFYSYGEISPFNASARCELHNQTMTITTLTES